MKYEDVQVATFQRYVLCECGGRLALVPDAPMTMSLPPWWLHQCQGCGEKQYLQEKSPGLVTREIK